MAEFQDVIIVVSHLCRAYMEVEKSHTRREKLEHEERKRRERQKGSIDVEFRVIRD